MSKKLNKKYFLIRKLLQESRLSTREMAVIDYFLQLYNIQGKVYPSLPTIADKTGMSLSTAKRTVQSLVDLRLISKTSMHRKANGYTLNQLMLACSPELSGQIHKARIIGFLPPADALKVLFTNQYAYQEMMHGYQENLRKALCELGKEPTADDLVSAESIMAFYEAQAPTLEQEYEFAISIFDIEHGVGCAYAADLEYEEEHAIPEDQSVRLLWEGPKSNVIPIRAAS